MRHTLTLFLLCLCTAASAYDFEVDGIYYNITDEHSLTVTFAGPFWDYNNEYSGHIVIPETVHIGSTIYTVVAIGESAFRDNGALESVSLPPTIVSIGYWAFANTGLSDIVLPNSLTYIDASAFHKTKIREISIPYTVTDIMNAAFLDCDSLERVTIGDFVHEGSEMTIQYRAFGLCDKLREVEIGNQVDTIGMWSFEACRLLTDLTIGKNVKAIGDRAFIGCSALEEVELPNSLELIDWGAFGGNHIKHITFGNGLRTIADYAFNQNNELEEVTLPNSVEAIGRRAFYECKVLKTVRLSSRLAAIANETFENCVELSSIAIPDACQTIGERAFHNCKKLSSVTLGCGLKSIEKEAFYVTALEEVVIPDSTLYIGEDAFKSCYSLARVKVGQQTREIGPGAFSGASVSPFPALSTIEWGDSLKYLGSGAFAFTSLQHVSLPEGLETIGSRAFSGCKYLEDIRIPESVTSITPYICKASSLKAIFVDEGNACYKDIDGVLYTKDGHTLLEYPNSRSSCCMVAPGTKTIDDEAFGVTFSRNVRTLILPASVDTINSYLATHPSVLVWQNPDLDKCHFPYDYYKNRLFAGQDILFIPDGSYEKCMLHDHLNRCNKIVEKSLIFAADSIALHVASAQEHLAEIALCYGTDRTNFICPATVDADGTEYQIVGVGQYCLFNNRTTLDSIHLHKDITYIESHAFPKAKVVHTSITNVFDINDDTFNQWTYDNAPLIVPYGTKNEYLGANGWKNFKKIIEEEKDKPTGLSSAHAHNPARSQLYNLKGQKLNSATRRGIYIRDGKKIANY